MSTKWEGSEALRRIRGKRTQAEFADSLRAAWGLGVSVQMIRRWEAGTSYPQDRYRVRLERLIKDGGLMETIMNETVEKFTLFAGTVVHCEGIPVRLTKDTVIETHPGNVPLIVSGHVRVGPHPPDVDGGRLNPSGAVEPSDV